MSQAEINWAPAGRLVLRTGEKHQQALEIVLGVKLYFYSTPVLTLDDINLCAEDVSKMRLDLKDVRITLDG